ncbi:6-phosphogluconolactonase [Elizabethkingia meningoseptica]|uniref:lactonase family protein n=1 Tax=Elizabethkingia meningoseptica TaxID=238 RepID=UPI000332D14A|nr:lactonase family protein [Elizabethkingia meningoseptica]AQX05511.1 6-phosphogluconolactonase [Elizabethkingia meningoseptica]AQX47555.1 6-phosphogluconolactonase [Elizabethkingia meningoseptica]EOR30379.1 3-carboxymuconate cyclase [Elizabethkingia meningoseptica ATCC 13253 = NBRC 12535]KUY24179.1 6-phosphogluconolactonase [Elizabethkingia meningoseptica]OPB67619.1 6-phosphogluconolactonase [Elizabethkingia meningoseptica]
MNVACKSFLVLTFSALLWSNCSAQKVNNKNEMYMLAGTYTAKGSKGIYVYKVNTETGKSHYVSEIAVEDPSYLVFSKNGKYVYTVTEKEDQQNSKVNAFSFDKKTGKLSFINSKPAGGGAPCHINVSPDGKRIITANYMGGSITEYAVNNDGSLGDTTQNIEFSGNGADKERQTQPHLHFVTFTPDAKYLFADDLGTDKIYKYQLDTKGNRLLSEGTPSAVKVKEGSGPRHLTFHPNGKYAYLITEISGDVIAFNYKDGNLSEFQTVKADTLNARGSADIHISPNGRFLYASNRLKGDGIAIFSINPQNGNLTKAGYQPTGIHPRNFVITPNGKLLLVANRDSDQIQVFKIDSKTGLLKNTNQNIKLSMPVCLKFAK